MAQLRLFIRAGLGEADSYDLTTGKITRAPTAAPPTVANAPTKAGLTDHKLGLLKAELKRTGGKATRVHLAEVLTPITMSDDEFDEAYALAGDWEGA